MSSKTGTELFFRGASSYLDALTAIAAFQSEGQDMCTEVYTHYSSELATQMGLTVEDCRLHMYNNPSERWAEVGIQRPAAQQGCFFYLYLSWGAEEDEEEMIAGRVYLELYPRRLRDEISDRFKAQNPSCRVKTDQTYGVVLVQNLKDLSSTGDVLDGLRVEWLGYCKSVGGLKLQGERPAEG